MKTSRKLPLVIVLFSFLAACNQQKLESVALVPPPLSFDPRNSDPAAVELVDTLIHASGGAKAWEETRTISWNASTEREIFWDKQTGKVRINDKATNTTYLLDINTNEGRVRENGTEKSDDLSLRKGFELWTTDLHDLFLPFHLKSAGRSFSYLGDELLPTGEKANIIDVSTGDDGVATRQYRIFVGLKDNLVTQIRFYDTPSDSIGVTVAFDNYKKYGDLILSADRTSGSGPHNVKVNESIPANIFEEF